MVDPKNASPTFGLLELVRFLRMQSGAGRVSLLLIEFRQAPVDDGAAQRLNKQPSAFDRDAGLHSRP